MKGELQANTGTVTATAGTATAISIANARASLGTLNAFAVASGGGGSVEARTQVTVSFIDLVQVTTKGTLLGNFDMTLRVDGSVSGANGTASALAQVWWIPEESLGQAANGNFFFGHLYADQKWVAGGVQGEARGIGVGQNNLRPGQRFWILGVLQVEAARIDNRSGTIVDKPFLVSTADFFNTMHVFIDPAADSPGARVVSVGTGFDYLTPVPEPSSALLLSCGFALLVLCSARMRR